VVSTPLKNIGQNGNLPQVGVNIKNVWNHHLVYIGDGFSQLHSKGFRYERRPWFSPCEPPRPLCFTIHRIHGNGISYMNGWFFYGKIVGKYTVRPMDPMSNGFSDFFMGGARYNLSFRDVATKKCRLFGKMPLNLWSNPLPGCQLQMKVYKDSLLKMECNPGGGCYPGWGVVPTWTWLISGRYHLPKCFSTKMR